MIRAVPPPQPDNLSPRQKRTRLVVLALLLGAIAAAIWFSSQTETGRQIFNDSAAMRESARTWVADRPLSAAVVFAMVYLVCGMLLLPIWWLQILSGFVFGLIWGCVYSLLAAALAATVTMIFSRWLAGAWFRQRIEAHLDRVKRLEVLLGNNGLLVVMAVRLASITPFGISNYLFGLTRIRAIEVFLGSIFGGFPALAIYVTIGADSGQFKSPQYWLIFGSITLVLIMPLVMRYVWPRWFRKIGVE